MRCEHGWDIEGIMLDVYSSDHNLGNLWTEDEIDKGVYVWKDNITNKNVLYVVPDRVLDWFGLPKMINIGNKPMNRWSTLSDDGVTFNEFREFIMKFIGKNVASGFKEQ